MAQQSFFQALMLQRFEDWPRRLAEWETARRDVPFAWGTNDCVTSAASAVEAMTGVDPIAHLPAWRSVEEAAVALRQYGGVAGAVSSLFEEVGVTMVQRGDIVLIPGIATEAGDETIAVVLGGLCAAPGRHGFSFQPVRQALRAWKVARG